MPATGADASWRRADPDLRAVPDRADPMFPASRPGRRAPGNGTGGTDDRRAAGPGAHSATCTAGRASARRSPNPRSSGPRSRGPRSWARRCRPCRSAGRDRRGSRAAARSGPAAGAYASGPAGGSRAGAAYRRGAATTGRTRRRHRPAHSRLPRPPPGRRGVHPGVFAWAGHRHRGPGRCRHVPPGTSWAGYPAAPQDMPLPDECRSGEIPCRT
jgi:hypothetical protein